MVSDRQIEKVSKLTYNDRTKKDKKECLFPRAD